MIERADLDFWRSKEVGRLLALVETERRYYQAIVATVPVGLLVVTKDLRIASANRSLRMMMSLRPDEVLRQRLIDVLPAEGLAERAMDVLSSGVPQFRALFELDQPHGGRLLRISITSLPSWEDEYEREALLLVEDLSDFLQRTPPPGLAQAAAPPADAAAPPQEPAEPAEPVVPYSPPTPPPAAPPAPASEPPEVLREREEIQLLSTKMEALGRLAAGLAHDYNNLVMIIQGYAQELLEGAPAGSTARDDMEQILRAAEKLGDRNALLSDFSRRNGEIVPPLDLNAAVTAAEPVLRRILPANTSMALAPGHQVGKVPLVPQQAETLVTGIVSSAGSLIPAGGVLRIVTGSVSLPGDWPAASHLPAGDYVRLSVEFPGALTEEARERLFEPYEPGRPERLGMFLAYATARRAGGSVRLVSSEGAGTSVQVYLPEIEKAAPEIVKPAPPPAPPVEPTLPPRETVLLVEDESGIRALMRKILVRQGYRVLEAENGAEALRVAAVHSEPIGMLITDLVMPECGGRQLAEQMTAARPDLKVLYVASYTDDPVIRSGHLPAGTGYLQKPFTLGALVQRVEELLAGNTPPPGA